jgi:hypothetical protein
MALKKVQPGRHKLQKGATGADVELLLLLLLALGLKGWV